MFCLSAPQAEAQSRLEQGDEDARFLLGVEVPDSWKGGFLGFMFAFGVGIIEGSWFGIQRTQQ